MDTSRVLYLQDYKNIYLSVTTRRRRKDRQTDRETDSISFLLRNTSRVLYLRGRDLNTDKPTDIGFFLLMDTSRVLYLQDYKNIYLPMTTRKRRKDGQTNRVSLSY